jgi:hypothetical protein
MACHRGGCRILKEREVLTSVLPQGDAILYVQDLENAASILGIDVDEIIVSEAED